MDGREEEAGDPGSATACSRTKAWMGGSDGDFAAQKARSAARVDGDGFSSRSMLLSPC